MNLAHIAIIIVIVTFFAGMIYSVWHGEAYSVIDVIVQGILWAMAVVLPLFVIYSIIDLWRTTA